MTIEINANTNLLPWPSLQHQQGNFELLIKQQLENGSHQLTQSETHSHPEGSSAPFADVSVSEHPDKVVTAGDQSSTRNFVEIATGKPSLHRAAAVQKADTLHTAPKPLSKTMDLVGLSSRFAELPSASDIKRSSLAAAPTSHTDVTSNFKPNNILVIRGEQEVRIYIRDFFADEQELAKWADNYLLDAGNEHSSPTHIYINGKPFRMNGSKLVLGEDRHGN